MKTPVYAAGGVILRVRERDGRKMFLRKILKNLKRVYFLMSLEENTSFGWLLICDIRPEQSSGIRFGVVWQREIYFVRIILLGGDRAALIDCHLRHIWLVGRRWRRANARLRLRVN